MIKIIMKWKKDSQRIAKIKPFINKYNWEDDWKQSSFPSEKISENNVRKIM